jgi:hypothetical protein
MTPVRSSRTESRVHRVFQAAGERGHGLVGVVARPVEPAVHRVLHPSPQRVEQRRRGQRGGGHRHRAVEPQHLGGQQYQPGVHPDQHPGHDRVGQRPADDPVDVVQAVLEDPHPDANRQGGQAEGENLPCDTRRTDPERHGDHAHGDPGPAGQPLELLAPFAHGAPPAEHLVGHERHPDDQDHAQAQHLRHGEQAAAVRVPPADHVAEGVHADVMTGHRGDRRGEDGRRGQRSRHRVDLQHPPPSPRRQPAVREQQDHHREHQQRWRPERLQQNGDRGQRETVVAEPVVQRGIEPDVGR